MAVVFCICWPVSMMLGPKSAAMEHCHAFDTLWTSLLLIWKIGMAGDNTMTIVFNLKVCLTDHVMQWYIWQIGLCNGVFDILCYAVVFDRSNHVMQWYVWQIVLCRFDWSCLQWHVWPIMFAVACLTDHVMLWWDWIVPVPLMWQTGRQCSQSLCLNARECLNDS